MERDKSVKALEVKLSSQAKHSVREYTNLVADTLILNSKCMAAAQGLDCAEATHIRKSYEVLTANSKGPSSVSMSFNALALVVLGAAIQAIYSEYISAGRKNVLLTCFIAAFISLAIWLITQSRR